MGLINNLIDTIGGRDYGTNQETGRVRPVLGNQDWVGKLVLEYYGSEGDPIHRVIPFYENCRITETQSSRLTTYSPIGRAGNSFAYTGADSRQFKLKFAITLPNLYNHDNNIQTIKNTRALTQSQKQATFFGLNKSELAQEISQLGMRLGGSPRQGGGPAYKYDVHYRGTLDEISERFLKVAEIHSPMYQLDSDGSDQRRKILDRLASMVASVRSCVVNDAQNPVHGIPIVRLNYGILYDNVPCVCDSYNIDYDENAGFDLKTLMPRRLFINMSLRETRTNANSLSRPEDKIQGWEVILSDEYGGRTMDPGGGF